MKKQTPLQRAEAVLRLAKEDCRPIQQFTALAGCSKESLVRYCTQGKRGIFLDAVLDRPTRTWLTSAQAVARFLVAVAEREAAAAGGAS